MSKTRPPLEDLNWDDLDKTKYYIFGPSLFLGVRALVYPFNLVKTRLQMQQSSQYTSTRHALSTIVQREGIRGLFKGFGINSLNVITGNLYITMYELSRKYYDTHTDWHPQYRNYVAGAAASLISQTAVVPLDIVSQRLMVAGMTSTAPVKTTTSTSVVRHRPRHWMPLVHSIFKTQGFSGFYRGYAVSVATHTPSSAIWWGTYGYYHPLVYDWLPETSFSVHVAQALGGGLAGLTAALLTQPMDVIRTRTQLSMDSTARVMSHLYQTEGLSGFLRGVSARMLMMGHSGMLVISTYELVKRLSRRDEDDDGTS